MSAPAPMHEEPGLLDLASGRVVPIKEGRPPAPPVPPDADVTWADDMPLDVRRLRDSGIAQGPSEVFHAAVLLWCTAWQQVPAGSLPDNDVELSAFAGLGRVGLPTWMRIRAEALRGFVKCRDSRLYHPVICEKVLEVLSRKKRQSEDGKRAAMARWKRTGNQGDTSEGKADAVPSESGRNAVALRIDAMDRNGMELIPSPNGEGVAGAKTPATCPPCPHQEIVALFHEMLPTLQRVDSWEKARKSHLQARWRERFVAGKFHTKDEGLAWFRRLFAYVGKSKFLTGQVPGREGRAPFALKLWWLVMPENFAKVIEGDYDNHA